MSRNLIKKLYEPSPERRMSVVVMLSGTGTNFTAIHREETRARDEGSGSYAEIKAVFTNAPGCPGAYKAEAAGIPVVSLSSKGFFDALGKSPDDEEARDYYDAAVIAIIEGVCVPDIIVLAGYRRRLGALFLGRYENRVLNLYPGDITKDYLVRGVDAPLQALRAGEKSVKCTVYLERCGERFGKAVAQSAPVSIEGFTGDDRDELNLKIREEAEWKLFPFVIHELIAGGRVSIDESGNLYVDNIVLGSSGYQLGPG